MSAQGLFLTLEGPDGSGKSTQFKLLVERLKRHGYKVKETREPGGPPLAEKIRALLLSTAAGGPTKEAELLLFLAARAQHVEQTIIPFLKKGYIVACEPPMPIRWAAAACLPGFMKPLTALPPKA
jgi:dTMP kinase